MDDAPWHELVLGLLLAAGCLPVPKFDTSSVIHDLICEGTPTPTDVFSLAAGTHRLADGRRFVGMHVEDYSTQGTYIDYTSTHSSDTKTQRNELEDGSNVVDDSNSNWRSLVGAHIFDAGSKDEQTVTMVVKQTRDVKRTLAEKMALCAVEGAVSSGLGALGGDMIAGEYIFNRSFSAPESLLLNQFLSPDILRCQCFL